jgi:NTE family protein
MADLTFQRQVVGPAAGSRRRVSTPRAVLGVAVLGAFMAFLDATIVNIALPSIARQFYRAGLSNVSWVLNAYNIVFAAFLVGGGQLADLVGRRRMFSAGLVVFTTASGLCALAPSLGFLIAARVVQACGAAALVPSSLAIVMEAHSAGMRSHAVALWAAVGALAAGVGPSLGGVLITASSWRMVFLVNIPVGVIALGLTRRVLVESRSPGRRRLPDVVGALVLALAIASLVLGIVKGPVWGWTSAEVIACFLVALVLGAYFTLRSSRHRVPVVDLSLFGIRAFAVSNGATVIMASGFYAYTLCNVLFLTYVWRYSVLEAGLALTPGPFVAMAVAGPASRATMRLGYRPVVVPGALIWAGGVAYFASVLGAQPDFLGAWLPGMIILGVGAGLTFPTLSGAAVGSVPGTRFAVATSLNSVGRQIGAALGVAVLIAIIGTPSPGEALQTFEHGWLFSGCCFLAGALLCGALSIGHASEHGIDDEEADPAAAEPDPDEALALEDLALPSLLDDTGERAAVAPQPLAQFLGNVPAFAPLSDGMREQIAELVSMVRLRRDEWLFREGDHADGVYVLRIGQLEVVQEGNEPQRLNTLTRGAVLGELALLGASKRSASVRALRESELLKITRADFEALLRSQPELSLSLARTLSAQLQASRARPASRRGRPVTIALCALGAEVPLLALADELSWALCRWGRVAVLHQGADDGARGRAERGDARAGLGDVRAEPGEARADPVSTYAPLVERCELDHDQVVLVCDCSGKPSAWERFALARADRLLVIAGTGSQSRDGTPPRSEHTEALRGCDLVGYDPESHPESMARLVTELEPVSIMAVRAGAHQRGDVARVARRLTGHAVGVVFSGGGARAFAHLGVIEKLLDAGLLVDRVGGVSMGAFVGGLLACGYDSDAIDACCYEEWVRRNPINDYTLPRTALIKGQKAAAMLERVFGEARIEELVRSYYCASVDLRSSSLVIAREGPIQLAVGASMALPLIGPPQLREERLLIDGSLLDNLPLAPMALTSEGPVLAVDIKAGEAPARTGPTADGSPRRPAHKRAERAPALPETMARVALLSSANTSEAARLYADCTIEVRVPGVGLLEFHQIDQARDAGRRATEAMLHDPPLWLVPAREAISNLASRRTVLRVPGLG